MKMNAILFPILCSFLFMYPAFASEPVCYNKEGGPHTIDMRFFVKGKTDKDFIRKIKEDGFVVLLHAIAPAQIDRTKALLDKTYEFLISSPQNLTETKRSLLKTSHVEELTFRKYNVGSSFFELLDDKMDCLVESLFNEDGNKNKQYAIAYSRRLSPVPHIHYMLPVDFHCDVMSLSDGKFGINVWTPLEECGKDNPTLQICPVDLKTVQKFLKASIDKKDNVRLDPEASESLCKGTAPFLKNATKYYFSLEKGDVIVFTNWVVHATYVPPQASASRTSVELRFYSNNMDIGL